MNIVIGAISVFVISFIVSFLLTPLIIRFSTGHNIGSCPNHRTIHKKFIPSMGGLAIFAGFFVGSTMIYFMFKDTIHIYNGHFWGILIGSAFILFIGIYDDLKGANCYEKFVIQVIAAGIAYYFGFRIEYITNPFGSPINLGVFSIPVTLLWIAGISNAINLMDGLDGLAAGMSSIVSIIILLIAYKLGNIGIVIVTLPLIGALLGFIKYNFNPAKVFMGDTGSLFIGFLLACISIKGSLESSTTIMILVPLTILGIPILDTVLAIVRRVILKQHPFRADKEHIHHRLLKKGLNHKQAVIVIYLACVFLGIYSILMTLLNYRFPGIFLLILLILVVISIHKLGYVTLIVNKRKEKIRGRVK